MLHLAVASYSPCVRLFLTLALIIDHQHLSRSIGDAIFDFLFQHLQPGQGILATTSSAFSPPQPPPHPPSLVAPQPQEVESLTDNNCTRAKAAQIHSSWETASRSAANPYPADRVSSESWLPGTLHCVCQFENYRRKEIEIAIRCDTTDRQPRICKVLIFDRKNRH